MIQKRVIKDLSELRKIPKNAKIGLALGGGSAKGLAHIGVLKVIDDYKIPISFIAGTSIGSIIGALYASNPNAKKIEQDVLKTEWKKLVDWTIPTSGFIKGNKIEDYMRIKLNNKRFKDLKIPLYVTACDLENDQEVIFHRGDVAKAVRASISLPGIFLPVKNKRKFLVDGGLSDPLPTKILKEAGADVIIAVELHQFKYKKPVSEIAIINKTPPINPSLKNILIKTYQALSEERNKDTLKNTNNAILINPLVSDIQPTEFFKAKKAIRSGEIAARKMLKYRFGQKKHF